MKKRQYALLVALTIISGFIGGAISNRAFVARPANAQEFNRFSDNEIKSPGM